MLGLSREVVLFSKHSINNGVTTGSVAMFEGYLQVEPISN